MAPWSNTPTKGNIYRPVQSLFGALWQQRGRLLKVFVGVVVLGGLFVWISMWSKSYSLTGQAGVVVRQTMSKVTRSQGKYLRVYFAVARAAAGTLDEAIIKRRWATSVLQLKLAISTMVEKSWFMVPHVVYVGPPDAELRDWVEGVGGRFFRWDDLSFRSKLGNDPSNPALSTHIGTWVRIDILRLAQELDDLYDPDFIRGVAVYLDTDVIVANQPRWESRDGIDVGKLRALLQGKMIAMAWQGHYHHAKYYQTVHVAGANAGVLLWSVPKMAALIPDILDAIDNLGEHEWGGVHDQIIINRVLDSEGRGNARRAFLPNEWNWKPTWPHNPGAIFLHFHGFKLFEVPYLFLTLEITSGIRDPMAYYHNPVARTLVAGNHELKHMCQLAHLFTNPHDPSARVDMYIFYMTMTADSYLQEPMPSLSSLVALLRHYLWDIHSAEDAQCYQDRGVVAPLLPLDRLTRCPMCDTSLCPYPADFTADPMRRLRYLSRNINVDPDAVQELRTILYDVYQSTTLDKLISVCPDAALDAPDGIPYLRLMDFLFFADVKPTPAPIVVILATDLSNGNRSVLNRLRTQVQAFLQLWDIHRQSTHSPATTPRVVVIAILPELAFVDQFVLIPGVRTVGAWIPDLGGRNDFLAATMVDEALFVLGEPEPHVALFLKFSYAGVGIEGIDTVRAIDMYLDAYLDPETGLEHMATVQVTNDNVASDMYIVPSTIIRGNIEEGNTLDIPRDNYDGFYDPVSQTIPIHEFLPATELERRKSLIRRHLDCLNGPVPSDCRAPEFDD